MNDIGVTVKQTKKLTPWAALPLCLLAVSALAAEYTPLYSSTAKTEHSQLDIVECLTVPAAAVLQSWSLDSDRSSSVNYEVDRVRVEQIETNTGQQLVRLTVSGTGFPSMASALATITINGDQTVTGGSYLSANDIHFLFSDGEAPSEEDQLTFSFGPALDGQSVLLNQ